MEQDFFKLHDLPVNLNFRFNTGTLEFDLKFFGVISNVHKKGISVGARLFRIGPDGHLLFSARLEVGWPQVFLKNGPTNLKNPV